MAPIEKTKEKTKAVVHRIHRTKPVLDYIAALVTIPVLITAIIINVTNLQNKSKATPTPTPTRSSYGNTAIQTVRTSTAPQPTSSPNCLPGIGKITITYPQEGSTISANPVCIDISYQSFNHCGVVWAYRINGGPWSEYSNSSVCLYNMPSGQVNYDLQVKSLVNTDTEVTHRSFLYSSLVTPTPTGVPTITPTPAPSVTSTP